MWRISKGKDREETAREKEAGKPPLRHAAPSGLGSSPAEKGFPGPKKMVDAGGRVGRKKR